MLGIRKFRANPEPLGPPLHEGKVWRVINGVQLEKVALTVYPNGFRVEDDITAKLEGPHSPNTFRPWSPFTVVEICQITDPSTDASVTQAWVVFKVLELLGPDKYEVGYFALSGALAKTDSARWIAAMNTSLEALRKSLFPRHDIIVRPLDGVPSTASRIMAGYLLHLEDSPNTLSLLYCELHTYRYNESLFAAYEDEECTRMVTSTVLTPNTRLSSSSRGQCTCFTIEHLCLCARSPDEKEIWLRAVSNVKVKLLFDAPDPTIKDLNMMRNAIMERIVEVEQKRKEEKEKNPEPPAFPELLQEVACSMARWPRAPMATLIGDQGAPEVRESTFLGSWGLKNGKISL